MHPTLFRFAVIALPLLCAYASTANAQVPSTPSSTEDASPKLPEEKPQVVNITGKGFDARREDTASKIVVGRDEISRFGDANVADILKRLPGVTLGGVPGRGGAIQLRGLGAGFTQILLNGDVLPPGFSLDSIPPGSIERIEVIRSGTAELSTQAIAGTINIILTKSVRKALREFKLSTGVQNGKGDANLDGRLADKIDNISYSLSGNLTKGKFDRNAVRMEVGANTENRVNSIRENLLNEFGTFRNAQLVPRVSLKFDNGDILTVQSVLNLRRFSGGETEIFKAMEDGFVFNGSTLDRVTSQNITTRTSIDWDHGFANGGTMNIKFGINGNKRREDSDILSQATGSGENLTRNSKSDFKNKDFIGNGKYQATYVKDHTFAAGFNCERNRRNDVRSEVETKIGESSTEIFEKFKATLDRCAVFAQDEWNINKMWAVYLGVRFESVRLESQGADFSVDNRFSVLSPVLQTLWKIPGSKNDQVRFALSRTYKAPEVFRLTPRRFISTQNNAANPDSIGNPSLRPELAFGLDATYEHFFNEGGLFSLNIYARKIKDITVSRLLNQDGRFVVTPINDGRANTYGLELEAKFPLRTFINNAPAIEVRGNLAINQSRLDSIPGPNNRLDSQTPFSANLGADYKFSQLPLTLGANFSFQSGGSVRIQSNQINNSAPKRILDIFGLWRFDAKTSLRVSVANALHQNSIASKNFFDEAGSFNQTTNSQTTSQFRAIIEHKF